MKRGKLTNPELIECVLNVIKKRRDEVKVPSSLAQDCASFEIEGRILISSDPITGADENTGELAIKINVNDICAAGGEPVLATVTVLAPPQATLQQIKDIMISAEREAEKNNLEIIGGHTEFTDAVNKVIVSVTIIGKTKKHITATTAKAGDSIIATKTIGIEGTSILANDCQDKLEQFLTAEELIKAKQIGNNISINIEADIAKNFEINAMHDITEGGLFGAVTEMAEASSVGAIIDTKKIKIDAVTKKICDVLDVDPYRLISSGSLLISASKPEEIIKALKEKGVEATIIGRFTENKEVLADFGDRKEHLQTKYDQLFTAVKRCK